MPSIFHFKINSLCFVQRLHSCQGNSLRSNCCFANTSSQYVFEGYNLCRHWRRPFQRQGFYTPIAACGSGYRVQVLCFCRVSSSISNWVGALSATPCRVTI